MNQLVRRCRRTATAAIAVTLLFLGCRSHQFARIVEPGEREMVGSHRAGSETFRPLVESAVDQLLARHAPAAAQAVHDAPDALPAPRKRICFVGVENKSAEEIGDFKEQIYESIDSKILASDVFQPISRRYVESGLRETRLRPDELMVPQYMRQFVAFMEQQGQPFDYLLFAKITSGTTQENQNYQRDYLLTLELIDVRSGTYDKESAQITKAYHQTRLGRWSASRLLRWK